LESIKMRHFLLAAAAAASLAFPMNAAVAQQTGYTSTDVLDFFVKEVELGAERGICVGTEEECNQAAKPAAFDVLVTFELDSATLTDEAVANLSEVAAALSDPRLSGAKFVIEGHTDASGAENYNERLSERRASAVEEFLVSKGVSQGQMTALGMGELSPRVPDAFDPVNRRVEMRLNLE
jgi:outer membrane protein OmpA-like peptidoglycan-associated protein